MAESSPNGRKPLCEKEKMLVGKELNRCIVILATFIMLPALAFNLDPAKILLFSTGLTLSQISPCFYESAGQVLENTVGKGEIARKEQFLLFPTVFFTLFENFLPFSSNLKLSSAKTLNLEQLKICRLGMG